MHIYAEMTASRICPLQCRRADALYGSVTRKAMHHAVSIFGPVRKSFAQPVSLFDPFISRFYVRTENVNKRADNLSAENADITSTATDVLRKKFLWRPVRSPPLSGIPVICHKLSRVFIDSLHRRQIVRPAVTDLQGFLVLLHIFRLFEFPR